jgi:beta-glucanase (GH16 family)
VAKSNLHFSNRPAEVASSGNQLNASLKASGSVTEFSKYEQRSEPLAYLPKVYVKTNSILKKPLEISVNISRDGRDASTKLDSNSSKLDISTNKCLALSKN